MADAREPYTSPAAPESISAVDTAALSPSGQYSDAEGYSSIPIDR